MAFLALFILTAVLMYYAKDVPRGFVFWHLAAVIVVLLVSWQAAHGWGGLYSPGFDEVLVNTFYAWLFGTGLGQDLRIKKSKKNEG